MAKNIRKRTTVSRAKVRTGTKVDPQTTPETSNLPTRPNLFITSVNAVNYNISPKWQKRLKELDDYQRSAPFVLSRFTLD